MSKRILLVGDGNHQFIINLVIWLKKQKDAQFQIDILGLRRVKEENRAYYQNIFCINDSTILYRSLDKIKGIRRFYRFFLYKKLLKRLPDYDFIHAHFIRVDSHFVINELKSTSNAKIILSIWGSDLYKVKAENENSFVKTCHHADTLTFANKQSVAFFRDKYAWKKDNLKICRFGLAPLETLKDFSASKLESKKMLNWNKKKRAIVIGYNLNPAQQHVEILRCFESIAIQKFKEEVQLILQLTYGGNEEYKNQIVDILNKLPYEYTMYDTFLPDSDIAYLRKASDIMIQLQKTDQFSGSMQEHLYTENIVITGSWLPYETLKEEGVWFLEIDAINELEEKLLEVLKNYNLYEQKTINTPSAIAKLSLWENNIGDWVNLY